MSIDELLAKPESKTLEFKRDLSSLKPVLKAVVAFANTAGGTLVVGRADDGAVIGLADVLKEEERLASAVSDSIRPPMMPEIEVCTHGGKALLVVRVPHWRGPFYVAAEGPEKGVYIRLGSTNRRAGDEILAELRRFGGGVVFDQMPVVDVPADGLDAAAAVRVFALAGRPVERAKLVSMGVLVPHAGGAVPSHGGLLLFGQPEIRQRLFPDARVSCARFQGTDKAQFIDRLDVEGGVLAAVDEVPKFIRRNTRLGARIGGMRRQDVPEYPELAVREVLVNAIAHADYSLTGMRILVAIYADRMEIQNPGMLPFGMTLDDFRAGVSKIRNRVIARVLRELGLMEEWGSGYERVLAACREGGYPAPEWQELGDVFRVVFRPHPDVVSASVGSLKDVPVNVPVNVPANVPVNRRQQWFMDQLATGLRVTAGDLAREWQVTEKTAKRDIVALKHQGVIDYVGPAKTGRFVIKGPEA